MRGSGWMAAALAAALSGCASHGFVAPEPTGRAAPDGSSQFAQAMGPCADVKSLTAEGALSGRVGGSRVRGRLHLGLSRAGGIRIEGVAPFGGPIFTLAGDAGSATLVLPRDGRVVSGVAPREMIEALAGVALDPGDLLSVATGCLGYQELVPSGSPGLSAHLVSGGLTWVRTAGGVDAWLDTQSGATPRVVAERRGDLTVDYPQRGDAWPQVFRLRRVGADGKPLADLTLRMTQVERNPSLPESAFQIDVPPDASPMSVDELRRTGLFGAR